VTVSRYNLVLLRTGTWAGSKGPIRYSAGQLSRAAASFAHKPVTYGHPVDATGAFCPAAQSVAVLNAFRVGDLEADVRFDGQALRGVAAIDRALLARHDIVLLGRLDQGERAYDVSTGLFLLPDGSVRGDHVGLVPVGACPSPHCGITGPGLVGNVAPVLVGDGLGPLAVPSAGYSWSGGSLS
jgi:hypothetical protein